MSIQRDEHETVLSDSILSAFACFPLVEGSARPRCRVVPKWLAIAAAVHLVHHPEIILESLPPFPRIGRDVGKYDNNELLTTGFLSRVPLNKSLKSSTLAPIAFAFRGKESPDSPIEELARALYYICYFQGIDLVNKIIRSYFSRLRNSGA